MRRKRAPLDHVVRHERGATESTPTQFLDDVLRGLGRLDQDVLPALGEHCGDGGREFRRGCERVDHQAIDARVAHVEHRANALADAFVPLGDFAQRGQPRRGPIAFETDFAERTFESLAIRAQRPLLRFQTRPLQRDLLALGAQLREALGRATRLRQDLVDPLAHRALLAIELAPTPFDLDQPPRDRIARRFRRRQGLLGFTDRRAMRREPRVGIDETLAQIAHAPRLSVPPTLS